MALKSESKTLKGVQPSVVGSALAGAKLSRKASRNSAEMGTDGESSLVVHQLMSSAVATQVSRPLIASRDTGGDEAPLAVSDSLSAW